MTEPVPSIERDGAQDGEKRDPEEDGSAEPGGQMHLARAPGDPEMDDGNALDMATWHGAPPSRAVGTRSRCRVLVQSDDTFEQVREWRFESFTPL